jgi:hypothetical protein
MYAFSPAANLLANIQACFLGLLLLSASLQAFSGGFRSESQNYPSRQRKASAPQSR